MRKFVAAAVFLMAGVVCSGYAQQDLPIEIRNFLENYVKDSTFRWGPLKMGVTSDSVQIKDIQLRTLQIYNLKNLSLNEYPDTVALSEIIAPNGLWRVLVMTHNKPLYELTLDNRTGKPKVIRSTGVFPSDSKGGSVWGPLLRAYPESTGINPVLFVTHCEGDKSISFLYFKQKGPRKIYYCNRRGYNRSMDLLFTASIETLDDSKKLIEYLKKRDINKSEINAAGLMIQNNTNAIGKNGAIEPKGGSFSAFIDGPRNF